MTDDSAELQARLRVKRKNYFVCAAIFLTGIVLHPLMAGTFVPGLAWMYLAWSASFVGLGVGMGAGWIDPRWSGTMAGLITLGAVSVMVHYTGGPASPHFPLLGSVPLMLALFTPDSRLPTLLSIGATLVATATVNVLAGVPTRHLVVHLSSLTALGLLALFGAQTYRRMREAERAAREEQIQTLARLAESERLRLRAERERAEVERLVLVGQLAAEVAHEVNNPLAFVKSNLGFLEQELRCEGGALGPEELGELLAETQQGVLRIQQIVMDLRRFSREGDGSEEEGLPEDAMREAKRLASVRLRGLGEVVLEVEGALPPVRLGQRHLVQVLLNLLLNAADAVEAAVPARRARVVVRARQEEGGVRLEVEDNGAGIAPEVAARLFEPFFTTKPPGKGTGLGLALCREYLGRVGGTLHAENRPEGGARFVLRVPPAASQLDAAA